MNHENVMLNELMRILLPPSEDYEAGVSSVSWSSICFDEGLILATTASY